METEHVVAKIPVLMCVHRYNYFIISIIRMESFNRQVKFKFIPSLYAFGYHVKCLYWQA